MIDCYSNLCLLKNLGQQQGCRCYLIIDTSSKLESLKGSCGISQLCTFHKISPHSLLSTVSLQLMVSTCMIPAGERPATMLLELKEGKEGSTGPGVGDRGRSYSLKMLLDLLWLCIFGDSVDEESPLHLGSEGGQFAFLRLDPQRGGGERGSREGQVG